MTPTSVDDAVQTLLAACREHDCQVVVGVRRVTSSIEQSLGSGELAFEYSVGAHCENCAANMTANLFAHAAAVMVSERLKLLELPDNVRHIVIADVVSQFVRQALAHVTAAAVNRTNEILEAGRR